MVMIPYRHGLGWRLWGRYVLERRFNQLILIGMDSVCVASSASIVSTLVYRFFRCYGAHWYCINQLTASSVILYCTSYRGL